jgi:cation transport ATPase
MFCTKCGAEVPEGAMYCVKCGNPVQAGAPQPPPAPPTWQSRRDERRARKQEEKGEKNEKSEKQEKGEKHEKGAMGGALIGGLVLIFLGVASYLSFYPSFSGVRWWALVLMALGVLLIARDFYYIAKGSRRGGGIIGGLVLLTIGYALYANISNWWPLVLVAIGLGIIASAVLARSRSPAPRASF